MLDSLKIILRDLGSILNIVGLVTLSVLIVPIIFGEYAAIKPILLTALVYCGLGTPLYFLCKNAGETAPKHAMSTASLGWLLLSLIGAIPFLFMSEYGINVGMDPLSAFFESVAGWTGTGLTMVVHENNLPHTLQFWRTMTQWIGGVGVIVLTIAVLARPGTGSFTLYRSEGREQKIKPSVISTVRTIWWIFVLYTIIGIVVLFFIGLFSNGGMTPWEAINHAMTGIATGGFSVTDDSITSYNALTQFVTTILMILGAIAFVTHYELLKGKVLKFLSDAQTKALFTLIFLGVIALVFFNIRNPMYAGNILRAVKESGFQFISALTCTGFATADISQWSEAAKLILSFAMVVGGAAGSTAGGIKLFRFILLTKGAGWRIRKALSTPHRVFAYRLGSKSLSTNDAFEIVNEAAIISFMWLFLLFISILVISYVLPLQSLTNVIFEVCSAQGNVGLTCGITGPTMPDIAKITLIFNMWIGRLEIIPILVFIKTIIGRD
ncbi:MAG TPA: TrkH family potassium uptake protein [Thermoplasmatales archaeon]|nr:TrkH family potassium uptake protein [Thermoplasmatales archaeon]